MTPSRQVETYTPEVEISPRDIERAILGLLRSRRAGASICPSEVARELAAGRGGASWRLLMQPVRDAATRLRRRGELEIVQGGRQIDPIAVRGPIRLRLPSYAGSPGDEL